MHTKLKVLSLLSVVVLSGLLPAFAGKTDKADEQKAIALRESTDVTTSTTVTSGAASGEVKSDPTDSKKEKKHPSDFNFRNYYSIN